MPSSDEHDGQDGACRRSDTNRCIEPGSPGILRTEHFEGEDDGGDLEDASENDAGQHDEDDSGRDSWKAPSPSTII